MRWALFRLGFIARAFLVVALHQFLQVTLGIIILPRLHGNRDLIRKRLFKKLPYRTHPPIQPQGANHRLESVSQQRAFLTTATSVFPPSQ